MKIISRWVLLLAVGVAALPAQVVTFQFSGSFEEIDGTSKGGVFVVFGMETTPVAFSGTVTFDLTAGPSLGHLNAGDNFEGDPLAHELFLFPAASVVAVNLVTGSKTWTLSEINETEWNATNFAVRATSDLTTVPSLIALTFNDGSGNTFRLGGQDWTESGVTLVNTIGAEDGTTNSWATGTMTVSAVPEPSTYAAIAGAGAFAAVALWRRRRAT